MTIFKKLITTAVFALCLQSAAQAQAPQKINYQGVGRNAGGVALANQAIGLQISILDGATVVYTEKHSVTTNAYGLFNVPLGAGTASFGTFNTIGWSTGNKFVKVEIDAAGGSNYVSVGTAELLSVPYALFAGQSNSGPAGPTGPAGPAGLIGPIGLTGATGATGAQGATGAAGSPGATGPAGATGSVGAQGPAGPAGVQGLAGAAGATGATGSTGPANTITIGSVTNGSAAATITGTAPNQILNLVLPTGASGAQGVAGPAGTNGATGPANTLTIGTVTNGTAAATITGTAPNQILNLTLPTGAAGPQGIQGAVGAAGPMGATGATGPAGAQGIQGIQGIPGTSGAYTAGIGISITGNVITNTGDLDAFNELQTLTLSGSTLTLSNGGGSVTLPAGGGGVSGSGTANYITKFTGATAVGNSQLQDNGTNIGIGVAPNTTDKVYMTQATGTGGLNIAKSNTAINSYSAKFTQSGTNAQTVATNLMGTQSLGSFSSNNPALLSTVTSGNGAALFGATIGSNTSAAIIGGSHAWTGGLFTTRDTLNLGASGLVGVTYSKAAFAPATLGYNNSTDVDSMHVGIEGTYNTAGYGIGVLGTGFGASVPAALKDIGVYGSANNMGVYGQCSNTSTTTPGYAVYADGNSYATGNTIALGTKSASIPTSKGNQLVYCMESPGIWFEDFGNATLVNGATKVTLDPLFLETVKIDDAHPMVVTVTPMGDCKGLFVVPGKTGFEVRELQGGNANIAFSYRISAKRLNYEDHRFGKDNNIQARPPFVYHAPNPIEPVANKEAKPIIKTNAQNKKYLDRIQNTLSN